jgi:CBS domain-containing protein
VDVVDVMTRNVLSVSPDTSVREAALLMIDNRISGLPVVEGDKVVGVISEADYVARDGSRSWLNRVLYEADQGPLSGAEKVRDLMSREPVTIPVTATVHEAARVMTRGGFKRLPVEDHGRMVGIVTRSDLVRAYVRRDEEIADDARQMVAVLPGPMATVGIGVEGAIVALTGAVDTSEEAQFVARMVKDVEGVIRVDNRLVWGESEDRGETPDPALPEEDASK